MTDTLIVIPNDKLLQVVDKNIRDLEQLLQEKKVRLTVSKEARLWLAEHGYDRKMGARPMERLVQDKIRQPLSDELLFGRLAAGAKEVFVQVCDGDINLAVEDTKIAA